jgi:pSer/pThr/pTyr-binding forkhead associated (FHA) protein
MWILRTVTDDPQGPVSHEAGSQTGERTFRILPGAVRTLGRAAGADFVVDAALVSRVHCRFTALDDGGLEIRDLDSTNGTFVNGHRVASTRLASGDRMQIGRVQLVAVRDET